jgi:hypothetical protein
MKSIIEPNRVRQIESETVHFFEGKAVRLPVGLWTFSSPDRGDAICSLRLSDKSARWGPLAPDRVDMRASRVAVSEGDQVVIRPQLNFPIFKPPLAIRWQTTYS